MTKIGLYDIANSPTWNPTRASIKKDGRLSELGAKYHIVYEAIAGNDDIHNTLAQWINERPWYDVVRVKDDLGAIEPCDPAHHEHIRLPAES